MDILFLITSYFFCISLLRNILFWVSTIQKKDVKSLLTLQVFFSPKESLGRTLLLLKTIGFLIYLITIFNDRFIFLFHFFVFFIFFLNTVIFFYEVFNQKIHVPYFSTSWILLQFATWFFIGLLYLNPIVDSYFWLLIIDRIILFIILIFWVAFAFPIELFDDFNYNTVKRKFAALQEVLVITVIGAENENAAKTIAEILGTKLRIMKTIVSVNSLSQFNYMMAHELTPGTEIIVLNVTAKNIDEVQEITEFISPKVCVIMSLPGKKKNKSLVKSDLVKIAQTVKNTSYVILKEENSNIRRMLIDTLKKFIGNRQLLFYSSNQEGVQNKEDKVILYKIGEDGSKFQVIWDNRIFDFTRQSKIYSVDDLLPAIIIARKLGFRSSELKRAVSLCTKVRKGII